MVSGTSTRRARTLGAAAAGRPRRLGRRRAGAGAGPRKARRSNTSPSAYSSNIKSRWSTAVKKRAAEAGVVLHVIDGKGDPNLQVTEVLDAVTKKPDALLINPSTPNCWLPA